MVDGVTISKIILKSDDADKGERPIDTEYIEKSSSPKSCEAVHNIKDVIHSKIVFLYNNRNSTVTRGK